MDESVRGGAMMRTTTQRVTLALAIAGTLAARTPGPAPFAAPHVIVFGGGPMATRVTMTDWVENQALMVATQGAVWAPHDSLAGRPRIAVAMYWGERWKGRTGLPELLTGPALEGGVQEGSFYPSVGGKPAIWIFGSVAMLRPSTRGVSDSGLRILERRGVPTRLEAAR